MDDKSKVVVSALAGAVIGAGIALLLAPASGKETRDKIAEKFNEAKDNVMEKGEEVLKKANLKS